MCLFLGLYRSIVKCFPVKGVWRKTKAWMGFRVLRDVLEQDRLMRRLAHNLQVLSRYLLWFLFNRNTFPSWQRSVYRACWPNLQLHSDDTSTSHLLQNEHQRKDFLNDPKARIMPYMEHADKYKNADVYGRAMFEWRRQ